MSRQWVFTTGFGNQAFEINCNSSDTYELATFLFSDFPGSQHKKDPKSYDILSADSKPTLSLWYEGKRLYSGESQYALSYTLMNEVLYHCINTNAEQHALHAGAVWKDTSCIVLAGKSGRGKSSLTAWLISHGYQYLTDELVFLSRGGIVSPVIRPISLKLKIENTVWLAPDIDYSEVISCDEGSMIPHRLLNADFRMRQPQATHVIFPEFREDADLEFEPITPAKSTLHLIESYVNARNLPDYGIAELSVIVRQCQSYRLTYSSFKDLEPVFTSLSSAIS